ncbi:unnamed protein product [Nezara viridula]|uniref:BZIP domain-containing protein n=1 Tax=Nezara viridula TaxID=85310 RepID=A0A9P0GY51_NEZVI|nr:unnamed protein product [Nezara viridula]
MSYNNVDVPYAETTYDKNYTLPPITNQCNGYYPYLYDERFSYMKVGAEDPSMATAEVSSSSDVNNDQTEYSPTDALEIKKYLRRIQNREAASRCRRKKMERISLLRQTLNGMYNRCQELWQNINAVEAEVRNLKAAGYGQHVVFEQYQAMKNGALEEPLPNLCPYVAVTDMDQPLMENQFELNAGSDY